MTKYINSLKQFYRRDSRGGISHIVVFVIMATLSAADIIVFDHSSIIVKSIGTPIIVFLWLAVMPIIVKERNNVQGS